MLKSDYMFKHIIMQTSVLTDKNRLKDIYLIAKTVLIQFLNTFIAKILYKQYIQFQPKLAKF